MSHNRSADSLGLMVGIVGIGLTIALFLLAERSREPVFLVETTKAQVVNRSDLADNYLRVFTEDSVEVLKSIQTATFYFWNAGKVPIRPADVLDSLTVSVLGSDAEILNFRILKETRAISEVEVTKVSSKMLLLDFAVLEREDGVKCQVTVASNEDWVLECRGHIIECGSAPGSGLTTMAIFKQWMHPFGFLTVGLWNLLFMAYLFIVGNTYSFYKENGLPILENLYPGEPADVQVRKIHMRRRKWSLILLALGAIIFFLAAYFGWEYSSNSLERNLSRLLPGALV